MTQEEASQHAGGSQRKLQELSPTPLGAFQALDQEIQRALVAEGYHTPTPIQEQCIPSLLAGRDLLGCAQTGTGKTAAFTLPLLQRLKRDPRESRVRSGRPRALILAPTRELAAQIGESVGSYGRFLPLRHTVVFGGVSQFRQVKALKGGVDVLVATPGRLLDLMSQGFVCLGEVGIFVLDEVDRMLDMGFINDIRKVMAKIPTERQTAFFSATMPAPMLELARGIVRNPARVTIAPKKPAVERIDQKLYFVGKSDKDALLASVFDDARVEKAIVFTRMKHSADKVAKKLGRVGIDGVALHGNKSQGARTKALEGFKRGRYRVLVATDVAARGLDVDDITHVINYDLPMEAETYVHRIGRTARAGGDGDALSFCSAEERAHLREIEKLLGRAVPVETGHAFHCSDAFRSSRAATPSPKRGGAAHRPSTKPARGRGRGRRRSGRRG